MPQPNLYSDDELRKSLVNVSGSVDGYMGADTYNEHKPEDYPSAKTISDRLGSWQEAKRSANLPARGVGWYEEVLSGPKYYKHVKDGLECVVCGEDFNSALAFHHPPDVEKVGRGNDIATRAPDRIYKEITGCISVCFNCHQKHHSSDHHLNVNNYERIDPPSVEDARTKLI